MIMFGNQSNNSQTIKESDILLLKETLPLTFLQPPTVDEVRMISAIISFNLKSLSIVEIQKEFTRFFRVQSEDYLPPYESCWILKKFPDEPFCVPRLYSKTTQEIKDIYSNLQILPLPNFSEPPDHIAFELAVYFSIKECNSVYPNESIKIFIDEHFNKWVPQYLEQLTKKQGIFYPIIGRYFLERI